jgi:alpha-D-xyloside xylohydrolase
VAVENTGQVQALAKVKVYPGANAEFTLYQDDGKTYAYEQGKSSVTTLRWDDAAKKLSTSGVPVGSASELLQVVGR